MKSKLLTCLALVAVSSAVAAPLAVVVRAKGDVSIGSNGRKPVPVTTGAILSPGDRIQTGSTGRALVRFLADQSLAEIQPGTTIDLDTRKTTETANPARRVMVRAGEAAFGVTPGKGRDMRFESATTVASVRGTGFQFGVAPNGNTKIRVQHGQVHVCNPLTGEYVNVPAGDSTVSSYDGFEVTPTQTVDSTVNTGILQRIEVEFVQPSSGDKSSLGLDVRKSP